MFIGFDCPYAPPSVFVAETLHVIINIILDLSDIILKYLHILSICVLKLSYSVLDC